MKKCIQFNPENRPKSFKEILESLRKINSTVSEPITIPKNSNDSNDSNDKGVEGDEGGAPVLAYVVATGRVEALARHMCLSTAAGVEAGAEGDTSSSNSGEGNKCGLHVVATFKGKDLVGTTYRHPLCERVSEVIAGGDYITTDSGTGLVSSVL